MTCEAVRCVASGGHLTVIQYLVSKGCPISSGSMYAAVCGNRSRYLWYKDKGEARNYFEVMKWLHQNTSPDSCNNNKFYIMLAGLNTGSLEIFIWSITNGYVEIKDTC